MLARNTKNARKVESGDRRNKLSSMIGGEDNNDSPREVKIISSSPSPAGDRVILADKSPGIFLVES